MNLKLMDIMYTIDCKYCKTLLHSLE